MLDPRNETAGAVAATPAGEHAASLHTKNVAGGYYPQSAARVMRNSRPLSKIAIAWGGQRLTLKGQTARSLLALREAGLNGLTALEASSWALRLAAYIHDLRRLGLVIDMEREAHPGGWHGRYRLRSPVTLLGDDSAMEAAA